MFSFIIVFQILYWNGCTNSTLSLLVCCAVNRMNLDSITIPLLGMYLQKHIPVFIENMYKNVHSASVQFSCSVVSDSLRPHGRHHTRLPCPSPAPGVYSNSCPLSWWWHPAISSSVIPFSFCLPSFPASGSFPMSQFFASAGRSIGVSASASVLPWIFRIDFL